MTDLTKDFCYNNSLHEKMTDCIISSMCIISNKENIILRDKYILSKYMSILNSLMVLTDISKEHILALVEDINSKNIAFLNKNNMGEIFRKFLEIAEHDYSVILNGDNINKILRLVELCYNESNDLWKKNNKIMKSGYFKYFTNLSDVELLALQKKIK